MNKKEILYMFAIVPDRELSRRIHDKRIDLYNKYKAKTALKPPVHITLFDPVMIPVEYEQVFERFMLLIQQWADKQTPFRIELGDYNFFNNPVHPVVYIDVVKSQQLKDLHAGFTKQLNKFLPMQKPVKTYKPHITIGYRDISPDTFPAIKADYSMQRFRASFVCKAFYLWKHNGDNWQIHKEFMLRGNTSNAEQLNLFQ